MTTTPTVHSGDRILVGTRLITVDDAFAHSLQEGDTVLGIAATGQLRRIPAAVRSLVGSAVEAALSGFSQLQNIDAERIDRFFSVAAQRLSDDSIFSLVASANDADVQSASNRGRSTTRLVLSPKMRQDMISAFRMWQETDMSSSALVDTVEHEGWKVEQWKAPLGVIGFVFEGRPNVFADATGVLKGGNSVVFRIGSDALGTAVSIMRYIIKPALQESGLPEGCVVLLESVEHAAGWALFADQRLSLAVARGSGQAVEELGSIAKQAGVSASLHGTGGAWIIAGQEADAIRLGNIVQYSLDRKVCNTVNVICIPESRSSELIPVVYEAAEKAAASRGTRSRIHAVHNAEVYLPAPSLIDVHRVDGVQKELQITVSPVEKIGHEFEWEENPEFYLVVVKDVEEAVDLFNNYSPQFVVSAVSEAENEREMVWSRCNAPFVGDGFTRWVDGQFALLRPELGLSNWQSGRLFARGGVLSGDSAYTIRLRVTQDDAFLHR